MQIDRGNTLLTVIVDVKGAQEHIAVAVTHAKEGLAVFKAYDGFVAGATHLSRDGEQLVQYLQWRDLAAYEACMADEAWNARESSRRFMQLMEDGHIVVTAREYEVVEAVE